ncbi:MAG: ubiquinol-cytochrome c reductase iron-sulfur subunit [Pelovirga sp.]
MEKTDRKRRRFLTLIISLLTFGGLVRFLNPRLESRNVRLDITKESIPLGGALVYRQSRVALIREEQETYALDLVCTHLGCTVTVTPTDIICPCHGSRFDRHGQVLEGPAERPLRKLQLEDIDERWVVSE